MYCTDDYNKIKWSLKTAEGDKICPEHYLKLNGIKWSQQYHIGQLGRQHNPGQCPSHEDKRASEDEGNQITAFHWCS